MKCPNCNSEMVPSHAGWLCISCGHIEPHKPGEPTSDLKPKSAPVIPDIAPLAPKPASKPEPPEPEPPKPESPKLEPPQSPEPAEQPEPPKSPTPTPAAAVVTPTSPAATKPPLQPVTHPRPIKPRHLRLIIATLAALIVGGSVLAYTLFLKPATPAPTPTPSVLVPPSISTSPSPAASPSASPSASPQTTPDPAAASTRDNQRRADLAAYLTAYKATATNGYYAVNPPAVTVAATDPTTKAAYTVAKAKPTALGQIEYRPGGACTGAGNTPGQTGTKNIALYLLLDDAKTTYCLDTRS